MKIIHAGLDHKDPRESNSITQLKALGYRYIRINNSPYDETPPLDHIFNGDKNLYVGPDKQFHEFGLTPRHYGCWLSHKQSINLGFADEGHFLICEADCKIEDVTLFKERLEEACNLLDITDYPCVRFEQANYNCTTTFLTQVSDNIWECDQLYLSQCYLVNGKSQHIWDLMYHTTGWHTEDIWLNSAFKDSNQKMLCFKDKLTTQFDGFSQIDKRIINR